MKKNRHDTGRGFLHHAGTIGVLCSLLAAPALGQDDGNVRATEYDTVDIAVQDTDLAQVLELLSIQTQRNIITSKNVSATISANLYDVTFEEALKAILEVNGYGYREEGNFIYVHTQEELEAIEAAKRRTESRSYTLDYLAADDAYEIITPLLSTDGKASHRGSVDEGFDADVGSGGADSYAFAARLIVNDYPENLDKIAELLHDADTPPQQVLVEATILQTALDEANAFGIDFSLIGDIDFTDLTNPLSAVGDLLGGNETGSDVEAASGDGFQPGANEAQALTSSVGNAAGPGGLKVGIIDDSISVFMRVLDEVTDSTILARPKIMCLNRQRAEVLVGARVGYLSTTATETTSTQTVEFLDTGINLMFRPFISSNGMIRLELQPSVSEAQLRNVTDQSGAQVTIPDELTNELTTNVRIRDGQTLVLGGLFKESTRITRRQVPFLGDIPLLGHAFRGQDDAIDRDEIIFLITPSIMHDEALWNIGDETASYIEKIQLGSRQGLLAFGRSRQTENHNNRAVAAYNRGDLDMAVYHANNSLRLNPHQPEMVRFRQQMMGTSETPFEWSIMHRAFRKEMGDMADPGMAAVPAPSERSWSLGRIYQPGGPQSSDSGYAWAVDPHNPNGMTAAQRESVTNRMIHEYFVSTGLEAFSPFQGLPTSSEMDQPGMSQMVGAENDAAPSDF